MPRLKISQSEKEYGEENFEQQIGDEFYKNKEEKYMTLLAEDQLSQSVE